MLDTSPDLTATIISLAATGIGTVLWWLLRQKDSAQQAQLDALRALIAGQAEQITLLFRKHDDDAQRLADLELKIAERHYQKQELDSKFDRLEASFQVGLDRLGAKFDRLADTLLSRVNE